MNLTTRVGLLAGASALALTSFSFADGSSESDVLKTRIAELEAKVASLETGDSWLTEQRTEEIRGIVQDVLADADTRASLLSTGLTSGYDNGFTIGDTGGGFLLRINGQIQTRWMLSAASGGGESTNIDGIPVDGYRRGFEVTRAKLIFSGHVVDPTWKYRIELDFGITGLGAQSSDFFGDSEFDSSDLVSSSPLRDAYIMKQYDNGLSWVAGRMRVPLTREELVDSIYSLAIDRSLVNSLFTGGITNGFALQWSNDFIKLMGALSNGAKNFGGNAMSPDVEISMTGRAEWLIAGNWNQFRQFTAPRGTAFGALVGGAIHWQKGESGTPFNEPQLLVFTIDGSVQGDGWNVFGSYTYRDFTDTGIPSLDGAKQQGVVFQGGFYITDPVELYARYEWADLNQGVENVQIITFGANWYVNSNVKATMDFGYAIDGISAIVVPDTNGIASDGRSYGWRADGIDSNGESEDGQWTVRGQIQLTF